MDDTPRVPQNENGEQNTEAALPALDPSLLQSIGGLLKAATEEVPSAKETTPAPVRGEELLGTLLSNPALLEELPRLLGRLAPLLSASKKEHAPSLPAPAKDGATQREALLLALKPFLSEGRQETIDRILRFGRLAALLKQLQ